MEQNVLLVGALLLTVGIGTIVSILDLLGGSLYDIQEVRQETIRLSHPYAKRYLRKPLISIIIPAYNNAPVLERSMLSILRSSYRKLEIIIVNDASTDDTKKVVQDFTKAHPSRTIKLLSKRRHIGRSGAINDGCKKKAKGELMMILDAGSILHKSALRNIVRHFAENDISLLAPNRRLVEHPSLVNLMQRLKQLVSSRPRKLNSVTNAEWDAGESGIVYRSETFKKLKGLKSALLKPGSGLSLAAASSGHKSYYASDVVVYMEPETSYSRLVMQRYRYKLGSWQALSMYKKLFFSRSKDMPTLLGWFRLPIFIWKELMVLAEPLLVAYFVYIAVAFKQPVLVIIGWLAISFLFVLTLWSDNQFSLGKKLKLTAYTPIAYLLLLIVTLVDLLATFIVLFNIKKTAPPAHKTHQTKRSNTPTKLAQATN